MTLKLLEGAVDALDAYLEANMAAKVAAVNARYGDTLLEDVKIWYKGSLPTATPEAPSIAIHGSGWTPKAQMMAKAGLHVSSGISLIVFVGDDDVERRFRKLCRYVLCLVELVNAGEAAMAYNVKLNGPAALSDSMATTPFLQSMIFPVLLEQMENY